MTTRNWPLLIDTMQWIIDHPETWDQEIWANSCGTAYCFAGHAAILGGGKQLQTFELAYGYGEDFTDLVTLPDTLASEVDELRQARDMDYHRASNGQRVYMMDLVAEAVLKLDSDQAEDLFDSSNTIPNLIHILTEWAEEDGVELPADWPEPEMPPRRTADELFFDSYEEY